MTKLFIHHPLFRLLSPLFGGSIVYLLILLVHNDVSQVTEQFLSQEIYVCIGLSYMIQEFSRLQLIVFSKNNWVKHLIGKIVFQVLVSVGFTIFIVTVLLYAYYQYFNGFTPGLSELLIFNVVFSVITTIYISLYLSHQLLHQINTRKISFEIEKKEEVEEDFKQFVREVNPELLFEGLESILVQIKLDEQSQGKNQLYKDQADEIVDELSLVYRYILGNKSKELVPLHQEIEALGHLVSLFGYLPYVAIQMKTNVSDTSAILPGSLLLITQALIKTAIPSREIIYNLEIEQKEDILEMTFPLHDRIGKQFPTELIDQLNRNFHIYTEKKITLKSGSERKILVPTITLTQDSE